MISPLVHTTRASSCSGCCCRSRSSNEYERAVVFRLGKLLSQPKGPGITLVAWPIDRMVRVSLRTIVMDVPPQDVITRDNVSVKVNAVVYFRVMDPRRAIVEVESYHYATSQLAQTTLRSVLGQVELDDLLSRARAAEPAAPADPRPAHRSVGHQGFVRGGKARRSCRPTCSARWPGRRKQSARSVLKSSTPPASCEASEKLRPGGGRHRNRAGYDHAPVPPDADGNRDREELDNHFSPAHRADQQPRRAQGRHREANDSRLNTRDARRQTTGSTRFN